MCTVVSSLCVQYMFSTTSTSMYGGVLGSQRIINLMKCKLYSTMNGSCRKNSTSNYRALHRQMLSISMYVYKGKRSRCRLFNLIPMISFEHMCMSACCSIAVITVAARHARCNLINYLCAGYYQVPWCV